MLFNLSLTLKVIKERLDNKNLGYDNLTNLILFYPIIISQHKLS